MSNLPANPPLPDYRDQPTAKPTRRMDFKYCNVLVVDDEPAIVEVVSHVLSEQGFCVHQAVSGERALEVFAEHVVDIVITDIRMDGISGFELMKRVQAMDSAVKVIVMTGYDSYDMVLRALQSGAYDYLDKPLDDHQLIIAAARRAADSSKMHRENVLLMERLKASHQKLAAANQKLVDMNKRLKILAITDGLTRLYNRRYIDQAIKKEAERRNRYEDPFSVILLDVDHFKLFNDDHGHDGGDQALQRVSEILTKCARNTDIVGRYGGEEFIVLLTKTPPENARVFAERVRAAIEESELKLETGIAKMTASIGIAGVAAQDPHISGRDLIIAADKALYAAKDAGRNQINHFDGIVGDTTTLRKKAS